MVVGMVSNLVLLVGDVFYDGRMVFGYPAHDVESGFELVFTEKPENVVYVLFYARAEGFPVLNGNLGGVVAHEPFFDVEAEYVEGCCHVDE